MKAILFNGTQPSQSPDAPTGNIDLPPVLGQVPVTRARMVIIMPTFAPGQHRDQHIVGRGVAGIMWPLAVAVGKDCREIGDRDLKAGRDHEAEQGSLRMDEEKQDAPCASDQKVVAVQSTLERIT